MRRSTHLSQWEIPTAQVQTGSYMYTIDRPSHLNMHAHALHVTIDIIPYGTGLEADDVINYL